jgi:predicted transcriptional regulator
MEADNFLSKLRNAKTDKKMMTIYLDKNLAKKLKVIAAEQDKTMSEIVEEALKDKLQIK